MTFLNNSKNSNDSNLWILYSDCSHYMNGRKDILRNLNSISQYTISLPNRAGAVVLQEGIAYLSVELTI